MKEKNNRSLPLPADDARRLDLIKHLIWYRKGHKLASEVRNQSDNTDIQNENQRTINTFTARMWEIRETLDKDYPQTLQNTNGHKPKRSVELFKASLPEAELTT